MKDRWGLALSFIPCLIIVGSVITIWGLAHLIALEDKWANLMIKWKLL